MTKTFGELVREKRKAEGLSQRRLAEKAYLSPHTIEKVERGYVDPSWMTLRALSKALSMTEDELIAVIKCD